MGLFDQLAGLGVVDNSTTGTPRILAALTVYIAALLIIY
jgi:hypothetical protein